MSKTLRRQLADAHQECRRLQNLLETRNDTPLRLRIAELERDNRILRNQSTELAYRLYAISESIKFCGRQVESAARANDGLPLANSTPDAERPS